MLEWRVRSCKYLIGDGRVVAHKLDAIGTDVTPMSGVFDALVIRSGGNVSSESSDGESIEGVHLDRIAKRPSEGGRSGGIV